MDAHPANCSGSGTPGTPSSSVWGRGRGRGTSPRPTCAVRRGGGHCERYYGRGPAPPDQRTLPPSPSCPLVSRQCGKISGFAAKTADGATTTQQSTRGGRRNTTIYLGGRCRAEAAGVVEEAAMTAATAAALVRCWCGNREGKWKRLLSCRKRSGRHTNEGKMPEKRRPTATTGAARERGDGGGSRRSGQGGCRSEYLLMLLLRGQRWPERAGQ